MGIAAAIVWVRRARETGSRTARPRGQPKGSKLDIHREAILGWIAERADITITEIRPRLVAERGASAGVGTVWAFLDRCGSNPIGKGTCDDSRGIGQDALESRALAGLDDRMLAPEAVEEAMRAYAQETNRLDRHRRSNGDAWRSELAKTDSPKSFALADR